MPNRLQPLSRRWLLAALLALPFASAAQQTTVIDLSAFDPSLVIQGVDDVVLRAPDRDIDRVYQAVHLSLIHI